MIRLNAEILRGIHCRYFSPSHMWRAPSTRRRYEETKDTVRQFQSGRARRAFPDRNDEGELPQAVWKLGLPRLLLTTERTICRKSGLGAADYPVQATPERSRS